MDSLVKLIKHTIDYSVSQDDKLQGFLTWIQEKAEAVDESYKRNTVRAFYFDLARTLSFSFGIDRVLLSAISSASDLAFSFDNALSLDPDRAFSLALDRALSLDITLTFVISLGLNPILVNKLQQLRTQLPRVHLSVQNLKNFLHWWTTKGATWTMELRQVNTEYGNLWHDWQFTKSQKQALERYHNANKFLIKLLEEPDEESPRVVELLEERYPRAISDRTRQEIEDNLLLPIAELKRRLPDQYS